MLFSLGFIYTLIVLAFRNEGNPLLQIEVEPTSDVSPSFDAFKCMQMLVCHSCHCFTSPHFYGVWNYLWIWMETKYSSHNHSPQSFVIVFSFSIIWLSSLSSLQVSYAARRGKKNPAASLIVITVPVTMIYFEKMWCRLPWMIFQQASLNRSFSLLHYI